MPRVGNVTARVGGMTAQAGGMRVAVRHREAAGFAAVGDDHPGGLWVLKTCKR